MLLYRNYWHGHQVSSLSMEEPSISAADGSVKLERRWLLSLLAFIKLLSNHVKNDNDDTSNLLITESSFSLTVYIAVSSA